jgi:hypothetical protein
MSLADAEMHDMHRRGKKRKHIYPHNKKSGRMYVSSFCDKEDLNNLVKCVFAYNIETTYVDFNYVDDDRMTGSILFRGTNGVTLQLVGIFETPYSDKLIAGSILYCGRILSVGIHHDLHVIRGIHQTDNFLYIGYFKIDNSIFNTSFVLNNGAARKGISRLHGHGIKKWTDGHNRELKYVGVFENGILNGNGCLYNMTDGKIIDKGYWSNGIFSEGERFIKINGVYMRYFKQGSVTVPYFNYELVAGLEDKYNILLTLVKEQDDEISSLKQRLEKLECK